MANEDNSTEVAQMKSPIVGVLARWNTSFLAIAAAPDTESWMVMSGSNDVAS